jgi:hypothetical protein
VDKIFHPLINNDKNKWLEDELARSGLKDIRLQKRFRNLLEQLWDGLGQTIPFACHFNVRSH